MAFQTSQEMHQVQRVQVGVEGHASAKRLKISVESYDEGLGWYPAGSLTIPMHQLPLLEQALQAIRHESALDNSTPGKIIPFPGLRQVSG